MTIDICAFIFDLDGVITDTAEFHYLAWNAWLTRKASCSRARTTKRCAASPAARASTAC
ncbi:MAG: hypothetical protein U0521_00480 [Anaerolineae bacterium]